jgi:hypothetical protein
MHDKKQIRIPSFDEIRIRYFYLKSARDDVPFIFHEKYDARCYKCLEP